MDNFLLSFIMMILWSILFGLLFIIVRKTKILRDRLGIAACIVVCIFLYIRMLVPFDIGLFQPIQIDWKWFCWWYDILNMTKLFLGIFSVTQILCFVWIVAAVIHFVQWLDFYRKIWHTVSMSGLPGTVQMNRVLEEVMREGGFRRKPEIVMIKNLRSPYSIGLLHQKILMPSGDYTGQELYYILFHEMTHFRNGDLWLKAAANVMCCIFWWNPLVYLMRDELDAVLEIRCDISLTEGYSADECREYLKTIVSIMKEEKPGRMMGFRRMNLLSDNVAGFVQPSTYEDMMKERFTAVAEREKVFGEKKIFSVFWIAIMTGLMILSYSFVVMPYYRPDSSEYGSMPEVLSEDIKVEALEDGSYILRFEAGGKEFQYIVDGEELLEFEKSKREVE